MMRGKRSASGAVVGTRIIFLVRDDFLRISRSGVAISTALIIDPIVRAELGFDVTLIRLRV